MKTYGAFYHTRRDADYLFYGELLPSGQTVRALLGAYWNSITDALYAYSDDEQPVFPVAELQIACPVQPSKIIAVGRNYHAHAQERGADVPASPLTWLMAPSSLLPSGGTVELPYPAHRVDFEAELGIVIGRAAKNIPAADADRYIFGYTTCLDISDRDIQDSEKQFARAKGFDTFNPVGPFVYTGVDPDDLAVTLHQNGELRQNGRTSEMIFSVREIVAFCSQGTTLLPGDLILTGTPAGVGPVRDGDRLEARVGSFAPLAVHVRNAAV